MKILAKLITGFLTVAVLCAVVGFVGILQMNNLNASLNNVGTITIPSLDYLNTISKEFLKVKVAVRNLANPFGHDDPGFIDRQIANIEAARALYRPAITEYQKIP